MFNKLLYLNKFLLLTIMHFSLFFVKIMRYFIDTIQLIQPFYNIIWRENTKGDGANINSLNFITY